VTPDGRYAISGSHDGTLRRWEIASGECTVLLDLNPQDVLSLAVSQAGARTPRLRKALTALLEEWM
jgi:WD40 repeat protein